MGNSGSDIWPRALACVARGMLAATAAVILTACGGGLPAGSSTSQSSWPWWRGPLNTGVAFGSTITSKNAADLTLAWSASLGSAGYGTPAVANGIVVAPATNGVVAFNAATGAQLWTYAGPEGYQLYSGPAIVGNTVFVSTAWGGGVTYALNLQTGALQWKDNWGTAEAGYGGARPMPDGTIIVTLANESEVPVCSHGDVLQLNAATGAVIWQTFTAANGGCSGVWSAPNVDGLGEIIFGSGDPGARIPAPGAHPDSIIALNAATGVIDWSFQAPEALTDPSTTDLDFGATPVDIGGTIVDASKDGLLYAVTEGTGAREWSFEICPPSAGPQTGSSISSPAWDGQRIYAGGGDLAGDGGGRFVALTPTGTQLWSYASTIPVQSPPTISNDVVLIGSADSFVALNAATGAQLWSYATGNRIWAGVAVVGNTAYSESTDGKIYAFTTSP